MDSWTKRLRLLFLPLNRVLCFPATSSSLARNFDTALSGQPRGPRLASARAKFGGGAFSAVCIEFVDFLPGRDPHDLAPTLPLRQRVRAPARERPAGRQGPRGEVLRHFGHVTVAPSSHR